jgi:hypothetical protein
MAYRNKKCAERRISIGSLAERESVLGPSHAVPVAKNDPKTCCESIA